MLRIMFGTMLAHFVHAVSIATEVSQGEGSSLQIKFLYGSTSESRRPCGVWLAFRGLTTFNLTEFSGTGI